jgi:TPR repeat protein
MRARDMRAYRNQIVPALCFALIVASLPAHADFYQLSGRYECLGEAGAVCDDAVLSGPGPLAAGTESDSTAAESNSTSAALGPDVKAPPRARAKSSKPKTNAKSAPATPVADPLEAVAARLQARNPAPGDLAFVLARAKASDSRALEMLAWCALKGVGIPANPLHAYLLYADAAKAGAADARANQAIVFKRDLTQEQRQQVLEYENGRTAALGGVP